MKLYRIHGLLLRHWYMTIGNIERILDILFWPIINLFVWGFAAVFVEKLSGTAGLVLGVFVGGLILWTLFDRAQKDVSLYVLEDFWERSVYHTYVTPVTEGEIFVSLVIFGFLRSLVSTALLVVLALGAYGFNIAQIGVVTLALFVFPLYIFGWAMGLIILAIIFQLGGRVGVLTWSLPFLLQPFAAIFYPVSVLPPALQAISLVVPLSYVFEGFRSALQGTFALDQLVWAVLSSFVYLVAGYFLFVWSVKRSKRTGFLSKQ